MYFPNRELLSFLMVLAFPNASKMGLDPNNSPATLPTAPPALLTAAMYSITFLLASVFPAPLSPLIKTHWSWLPVPNSENTKKKKEKKKKKGKKKKCFVELVSCAYGIE